MGARDPISRKIRIDIPPRAAVVVVGRTIEDCDKVVAVLKPRVSAKGGSIKAFSQLHQLEDLATERIDVLVLHPDLGPTARDVITSTARRANRDVEIVEIPG
jgi:hypothetical protein